jgi:hypothetical protein
MSDTDSAEENKWIQDFLFGAALYAEYELPGRAGYQMLVATLVVDGHCPYCHIGATFQRRGDVDIANFSNILRRHPAYLVELVCARNLSHKLRFILRFDQDKVQKIGQYPSLADIANDESRTYRKVLTPADASELYRAIGLAAHGVGIGSLAYLRRIFERLIVRRFNEYKEVEKWSDDALVRLRMDEKIAFLSGHLPDFLVKNKSLYSVLSKGIHELSEEECLDAFEFLKQSIFFILDDDRRKKEELDSRQKAEAAIAAFAKNVEKQP